MIRRHWGRKYVAVGVVVMAFAIWRLLKRNDNLMDKVIDMGERQTEALNGLAQQVETSHRVLK